MRITYYALKPIQVGDDWRQPGDLVPEAASWPFVSGYVREGQIAPVLVATLPKEAQDVLREWEQDQQQIEAVVKEAEGALVVEQAGTTSDAPAAEATTKAAPDATTAPASKAEGKPKVRT